MGYAFFCIFFIFYVFIFGLFVFFGCLALSGVLRFLASLLIEIASPRGAGVHACDRRRLSFLFLFFSFLAFRVFLMFGDFWCFAFLASLLNEIHLHAMRASTFAIDID